MKKTPDLYASGRICTSEYDKSSLVVFRRKKETQMFISGKQPDDPYSNDVYQKDTVTSEFNREHIYTQTTHRPP